MSQPQPYNRVFSFTNDQTANPSTKTPGNSLDAEFNAILTTFSQVLANMALLQRDDGQLANESVGVAQLKPEVSGGIAPATQWATATSYGVNASVFNGLKLYRCLIAHNSGTFATDLAAGDWVLLADFSTAITAQTAGVVSIGGLTGTFTVLGGGLGSTVLPFARYDAVMSLSGAQQLQICNNSQALYIGGSQSLNSTQQLQAANNILAPSAAGAQTFSGGQMATLNTSIGSASVANNLSDLADKNQALVNITTSSPTATQLDIIQRGLGLPAIMRSYLAGLTLSTAGSSATFSVAAGVAADSTNADMLTLASAISKTTSAWAAGNAVGGLDTGAIANTTWYHVHLIKRMDTQVVDVLISLSATSPTLPASYTLSRRIGAIKTNSSGQWNSFTQIGDKFLWQVAGRDVNNQNIGTTATSFALANIPTGIVVEAILVGWVFITGANSTANFYPLTTSDQTVTYGVFGNVRDTSSGNGAGSSVNVMTNTSAQIRARGSAPGATVDVDTLGWIDRRGRDA